MSILRFIDKDELDSIFDNHATIAMDEAFRAACKDLGDLTQPNRIEAVAGRIIDAARSGELDPNKLRDRALTAFGRKRP